MTYLDNPIVLAIDLGTTTGWAVGGLSGLISSGTWDLKIRKDESAGMRLIRFCGKMRDTVASMKINLIAFESVSAGNGKKCNFSAAVFQAELQGMIKRFSTEEKIESCGVHLITIKKHTTGKGTAGKPAVMEAIGKRVGRVFEDDNEADAVAMLYYVLDTHFSSL